MTRPTHDEIMADLVAYAEATERIAEDLREKHPDLPILTVAVMAGDLYSAERSTKYLAEGMPFEKAMVLIGSYARLDWVAARYEDGTIDRATFFRLLPDLWPGCDPDDSDPKWLTYWRDAWFWNDGHTILDDPSKPIPGDQTTITIYRGQRPSDPVGIAWTLDREIAQKFANGASFRTPVRGGMVLTRHINRHHVFAYLTDRGESEVLVDPRYTRKGPSPTSAKPPR